MAWEIINGELVNSETKEKYSISLTDKKRAGGFGYRRDGLSYNNPSVFNAITDYIIPAKSVTFKGLFGVSKIKLKLDPIFDKMLKEYMSTGEFIKKDSSITNKMYQMMQKDILNLIEHHGFNELTPRQQAEKGLFVKGKNKEWADLISSEKADREILASDFLKEKGVESYEDLETSDKEKYLSLLDGSKEPETENDLNPYVQYMERMRQEEQGMQLGLLNEQTRASKQTAEIAAQQSMVQQAQFKDQLIEQIKTDRLGKMRQGISPMQIANEELQFMVGSMQANQQQMGQVNQQQLGALQQGRMNPYQAYLNANQSVTGGQGYSNFAAGMAATDASSLFMQAQQYMRVNPYATWDQAYKAVSTSSSENISWQGKAPNFKG